MGSHCKLSSPRRGSRDRRRRRQQQQEQHHKSERPSAASPATMVAAASTAAAGRGTPPMATTAHHHQASAVFSGNLPMGAFSPKSQILGAQETWVHRDACTRLQQRNLPVLATGSRAPAPAPPCEQAKQLHSGRKVSRPGTQSASLSDCSVCRQSLISIQVVSTSQGVTPAGLPGNSSTYKQRFTVTRLVYYSSKLQKAGRHAGRQPASQDK